ncbi:MAG TPA: hypothetical protein VK448_08240 [Dissulfurispiraceae bacterium]|nr:hypothetical protein [Dissulfurispiraceae bacterium]
MRADKLSFVPFRYTLLLSLAVILPIMTFVGREVDSKEPTEGNKMTFPNYQATSDSPKLTDSETGIKLSFAKQAGHAVFKSSETWPLFGVFRADRSALSEFGSQIDAYVFLVITHKESNTIYTGRILNNNLPPKNVTDTQDQGGYVVSASGYFNVDLKAQCRIPAQPGKYRVIALLGKLASPVLEFEVE